jgi:hypothetical protein
MNDNELILSVLVAALIFAVIWLDANREIDKLRISRIEMVLKRLDKEY